MAEPGTYDTGWKYPTQVFQVPSDPYNIDHHREWDNNGTNTDIAYARGGSIIGTLANSHLQLNTNYIRSHVPDTTNAKYYYPLCPTGFGFSIDSTSTVNYIAIAIRWVVKTAALMSIKDIRSGAGVINLNYPSLSYPSTNLTTGDIIPNTFDEDEFPHSIWSYITKTSSQWGGVTAADVNSSTFTLYTDIYQPVAGFFQFEAETRVYHYGVLVNYTIPTGANLLRMGTF